MNNNQLIPEQLSFFNLRMEDSELAQGQDLILLRRRLETVSHWAPDGQRTGAPRVYEFPGAYEQLQAAPSKLPQCSSFYATQEVVGHVSPQLGGDAIVQWCFHGQKLPMPGCQFWAFSMHRTEWIGFGETYLEDGLTMASLDDGLYADFVRYEKDAHGLILVIFTHRMVRPNYP